MLSYKDVAASTLIEDLAGPSTGGSAPKDLIQVNPVEMFLANL